MATPKVNIIGNQIVRPASILRGLLISGVAKNTYSGSEIEKKMFSVPEKCNLLEGLGDDFLLDESRIVMHTPDFVGAPDLQPMDWDTLLNDAYTAAVPHPPRSPTHSSSSPRSCPPTPRSHFSEASSALPSPGSLCDVDDILEEDRPHSPIKLERGGKGGKIACPAPSSSSSLAPNDLFSQPEDKAVIDAFKSLVSKVGDHSKMLEERELDSCRRLTLLTQQRQKAEAKREKRKSRLNELREAMKSLKKDIVRQKDKCYKSCKLVTSLRREENDVVNHHDDDVRQLERHRRKIAYLRHFVE